MRGMWKEGSFTRDPKDMLSKALEMGLSKGATFWRNMKGCSFPRAFGRREKFLLLGKIL